MVSIAQIRLIPIAPRSPLLIGLRSSQRHDQPLAALCCQRDDLLEFKEVGQVFVFEIVFRFVPKAGINLRLLRLVGIFGFMGKLRAKSQREVETQELEFVRSAGCFQSRAECRRELQSPR